MWRTLTPAEKRDCRQRDTITVLSVLLVVLTLSIGWQAFGRYEDNKIIEVQAGLLRVQEVRINNLVNEVKELTEKAVQISRGAERTATVTAYTHTGNPTASGTMPVVGRTVAGPRWIPLGTKVWIEGVGERIVEDRTHIRFNGRYDVFMDSEAECLEWGIQQRVVIINQEGE